MTKLADTIFFFLWAMQLILIHLFKYTYNFIHFNTLLILTTQCAIETANHYIWYGDTAS